jgi:Domain of unknown function (DUF5050)
MEEMDTMSARAVYLDFFSFVNNTQLFLVGSGLSHGEWNESPPAVIDGAQTATWSSVSDGFLTGTEGWVRYFPARNASQVPSNIADKETIYITWDNPYAGSDSYTATAPAPYLLTESGGNQGDQDNLTFTLKIQQQYIIGNNKTKSRPFVTKDGWVWFQGTDNRLWKVQSDGTQQSNPGGNFTASSPIVVGDSVYFQGTDNRLLRMKTADSSGSATQISGNLTKATPFVTHDGKWVWFQGTDNRLLRALTDGTTSPLPSQPGGNSTKSPPFIDAEGWVWFQGLDDRLLAMKSDGTSRFNPGNNTTASTPFVDAGGNVWFQGTDNTLWQMSSNGQSQINPGNNTTSSFQLLLAIWSFCGAPTICFGA